MRRRRVHRIQARNLLVALLMVLAFCSGFFGHTLLSAHAEEQSATPRERYYTSVQLKQGDSLWNIASTYAADSGCSVQEYIDELKQMNGLTSEQIHAGQYLTVYYMK